MKTIAGPRQDFEIRTLGMKRSGNHAILDWICRQFDGDVCFLNDVFDKPSISPDQKSDELPGLPRSRAVNLDRKKSLLLLGYEDCRLVRVANNEIPPGERGEAASARDIIILRDPFNLFASRLKLYRDRPGNPFAQGMLFGGRRSGREFMRSLWMRHAREFLNETNHLRSGKVAINFNLWATDPGYRESICGGLGIAVRDNGLGGVSDYGFGSSFEGTDFGPGANPERLNSRWAEFEGDPEYLDLVDHADLKELAGRIFGDVPGYSHPVSRTAQRPLARKVSAGDGPIRIRFRHGLGDCTNFAQLLELYGRRGFRFEIDCAGDKEFVFAACGNVVVGQDIPGAEPFGWGHGPSIDSVDPAEIYTANKTGSNISAPPLPDIGFGEGLWSELCEVKLDLGKHAPAADRAAVEKFVEGLPRPVILLHTRGNTNHAGKDVPGATELELYRGLLEKVGGTVVLLDWDGRVERVSNFRLRHLGEDFGPASLSQLVVLVGMADLVIGVDSGPAHFSRFTDTPALFLWNKHHPASFAVPDRRHVHLVPAGNRHRLNTLLRSEFNIVESWSDSFDVEETVRTASRMLAPPKYLDGAHLGADVQIRQCVDDWSAGGICPIQKSLADRDRSFGIVAEHLCSLAHPFVFVETGSIRADEDWSRIRGRAQPGAGYSTYLFGNLASVRGGRVISVEIDRRHCAVAREATKAFSGVVEIVNENSLDFLARFEGGIDVLFLDSLDDPGHGLKEVQAGFGHVRAGGLIVYDDTQYASGAFRGKGAEGVPWLLAAGCTLLFSGHQTVVRKAT